MTSSPPGNDPLSAKAIGGKATGREPAHPRGAAAFNDGDIAAQARRCPSPNVMKLLSGFAAVHLSLVALSYLATVASSGVQSDLLTAFGPYLAALHFDAQQIPLSISTASATEKTHQLMQTSSLRPDDPDWSPIVGPGIRGGDRQRRWQRWLSETAELGDNEQGFLAAWLMLPIAKQHSQANQLRVDRQRDLMTGPGDAAKPPPYQATIVRNDDSTVRLIQVPPPRFTALSVEVAHD